jgi:uncharacterized membrane protein YeaQ/YmgE (transglycosylase-associated protein family)
MSGILSALILGLVVGALAKWIMPGTQGGGAVLTTILGIVGSMVGWFLAGLLGIAAGTGFSLGGLAIAVAGALLVLFVYGKVAGKKA